jgi:hypothetical protein
LTAGAWPGVQVTAAEVTKVFNSKECITCLLSRAHRLHRTVGTGDRPPYIGHSVSCDYVPVSIVARGGFNGYYLFRELMVGYVFAVLVPVKTDFFKSVESLRVLLLQHGHIIRCLYVDAGTVENARATKKKLNAIGITIAAAPPECQNQNPVERTQQTIANAVTACLCDQSALDNSHWGLALLHCVATCNTIPNVLSEEVSPMYAVTGYHPDLTRQFLFPFGQPVVCVQLNQEREKFRFSPTGEFGYAVGTSDTASGATLILFPGRSTLRLYSRLHVRAVDVG